MGKKKLNQALDRILLGRKNARPYSPADSSQRHSVGKTARKDSLAIPFNYTDRILLVGEGNFSFAVALHKLLLKQMEPEEICGGSIFLYATSLDSRLVCQQKYPDSAAHLDYLEREGVQILFEVDCTKLESYSVLSNLSFSRIAFNFPHVGLGIKDQGANVRANQKLLLEFFRSALTVLARGNGKHSKVQTLAGLSKRPIEGEPRDSSVLVSLKSGEPYSKWEIKKLASIAGYETLLTAPFNPGAYPGYVHRRTLGYSEKLSSDNNGELHNKDCRIYAFRSI